MRVKVAVEVMVVVWFEDVVVCALTARSGRARTARIELKCIFTIAKCVCARLMS